MPIDAEALRTGLSTEQRALRRAIEDASRELGEDDAEGRANLELRRSELRKVEHALQRHADGSWDRCERCDTRITEDQLRVVPTATHCTECAGDEVYWGDTRAISLDELDLTDG